MIILIGAAIAFMLIGFFGYNLCGKKFAGVIGVGGSYIILLGIMLLCAAIGQIIRTAGGDHSVSTLEIVGTGVIALLCLGYMVFVMIGRCETTAQRVALPFVACLIGLGLSGGCWRPLCCICPWKAASRRKKAFFLPESTIPRGCCLTWCMPGRTAPSMNAPNTGQRFVSTTRISGTAEHPLAGPGAEVRFCSKISCLYSGQQGFVEARAGRSSSPFVLLAAE